MKTVNLSVEDYLHKYKALKNSLELPLKVNLYFNFLEVSLENESNHKNAHNYHGFSPLFYPAFDALSRQEKACYLHSNIQFLKGQYDKIQTVTKIKHAGSLQIGNNFRATGQISDTKMKLTYWSKVELLFNCHSRKLKIMTKNRNFQIDLRLYLIRKSKKFENTLVLQAISEIVSHDDRKISIFFKASVFEQVFHELFKCVMSYRNQELYKVALDEYTAERSNNQTEISFVGINSRSLNFLSSRIVNEFLNFKDGVLKKLLKADFRFEKVYSAQQCKIEINRSSYSQAEQSIYKLETTFNCNVQMLRDNFVQKYKSQNFKYIMQSQQLQKCSNKYTAVYQKLLFRASAQSFKTIEHMIVEQLNLKQAICENQELLFIRGLKGAKIHNFIDFLIVKVKSLGTNNRSKLIIVGSFNKNPSGQNKKKMQIHEQEELQQIVIMFLLEFSEMIFRKDEQAEIMEKVLKNLRKAESEKLIYDEQEGQNQNLFMTVQGNFAAEKDEFVINPNDEDDNAGLYSNQVQQIPSIQAFLDQPQSTNQENKDSQQNSESAQTALQTKYIKNHYQLKPAAQNPHKAIEQKHFIFEEWTRKSKGGVICNDLNAVSEQKKVANFIIKSLGKSIFQSKGILNLSLPVTIFKSESHLHSIARNLCFAPQLLQKAAKMNPIERMKMVMLYALSVTVSSISVSKPFNPVLGETLQMWIDGCPVYLEQISHHPPISAYYMVGRGYKAYGCIGSKISFGFNSITGYSQQPSFVQFDDGTIIELNFGRMIINGIILGERNFNFTDKMYAIDQKNNLFMDLKFGEQKSFFSKSQNPEDYFKGRLISTTPQFVSEFYQNSQITFPQKEHIVKQISKFEGTWNGRILIDSQEVIDFSKVNRCVISQQKYPLMSDSSYREDIRQHKLGYTNNSQHEKEVIENMQRRDRKLREDALNKQ